MSTAALNDLPFPKELSKPLTEKELWKIQKDLCHAILCKPLPPKVKLNPTNGLPDEDSAKKMLLYVPPSN